MKSRSKFYLFAGFGASVAALVVYLLASQPEIQKPAAASARSTVTPAPKVDSANDSLPIAAAEKTAQTPGAPLTPPPPAAAIAPSTVSLPSQLAANEEKPVDENASATGALTAENKSLPRESIATRRMYMAHASLRTPEVANPDSEANRQILQTMVIKALASAPKSSLTANHKN